ncbi:hypothetical protein GGI12_003581 [Dipsacomyces acuminosporus]|nr:hypothetical protein GGI12_003581 [Dipsacomyces acuminosporus]
MEGEVSDTSLLNALGAYGSDENSSSEAESLTEEIAASDLENESAANEQRNIAEELAVESAEKDNSSTTHGPDEEELHQVRSVGYKGVSDGELAEYKGIKRGFDMLLGCDKVCDFAPLSEGIAECSAELQAKFKQWHELKAQGANFNEALMRNKTFRNPNIYKWLVEHFDLDETGSNFPANGFSSDQLRSDFSAKALAEYQEQRARQNATRAATASNSERRIEFRSAGQHASRQPVGTVPVSTAHTSEESKRTLENAVQRARLIAHNLAQSKRAQI